MARLTVLMSMPGGGQTKLPPTRTLTSCPCMSSIGCHSHAAGGFSGLLWIASSKYGACSLSDCASASRGDDVIVKPPAFSTPGTKTSSHWPARNLARPSAHVASGAGCRHTLKPLPSLRRNRNVLMRSLTTATLATIAVCRSFSLGSVAVRSWWLRIDFADRVCAMLLMLLLLSRARCGHEEYLTRCRESVRRANGLIAHQPASYMCREDSEQRKRTMRGWGRGVPCTCTLRIPTCGSLDGKRCARAGWDGRGLP